MPHGRHATLLAGLGLFWGACGGGCHMLHYTGPAADSDMPAALAAPEVSAVPLAPRSVVAWSIESSYHEPSRVLAGQAGL